MFSSGRTAIDGNCPTSGNRILDLMVRNVELERPHRGPEILQLQRTQVPHCRIDAAAHKIVNGPGHDDAAAGACS